MAGYTTIVFGVPVPSSDRTFLLVVHVHIVMGIVCVAAGVVAMLSRKGRGRHSMAGKVYYWSLAIVAATAAGLSAMRWAEDYHLFLLGMLAFAAATPARAAVRRRWRRWASLHIAGMGASYILTLTRVLRGQRQEPPLWKELPQPAFWLRPPRSGFLSSSAPC